MHRMMQQRGHMFGPPPAPVDMPYGYFGPLQSFEAYQRR